MKFSRAQIESDTFADSRTHGGAGHGPIEAGPVTVPAQKSGEMHFLTAKPY